MGALVRSASQVGRGSVVVAVAVAVGLWASFQDPSPSMLLVLSIGIVVSIPIGVRVAQGRFDPFEPTVVFALAYGAMFVVRPAVMIADNNYSLSIPSSVDLQPAFNGMLVLALLGALSFVCGYALPFGKRLAELAPRPPMEFEREKATFVALGAAALGALSFLLYLVEGGGVSNLSLVLGGRSARAAEVSATIPKFLDYGNFFLVGSSVLLFSLYVQRRSTAMLALTVAVCASVLLIRGSVGSRYALLPLIGSILIVWFMYRDRRPRLLSSCLAIAAALVVSAGLFYGRTAQHDVGPTGGADYVSGFAKALSAPDAPLEPILRSEDAGQAVWLTGAMAVIPEQIDYGFGRFLATDLLTRWVPRQVWIGKPKPPHIQVTQEFAPGQPESLLRPAYSVLMHLYLDFGMFGALLLVIYGVGFRALFEWFRLHPRSVPTMAITAVGIVLVVPVLRDNPVDALLLSFFLLAPLVLAYVLSQDNAGRAHR